MSKFFTARECLRNYNKGIGILKKDIGKFLKGVCFLAAGWSGMALPALLIDLNGLEYVQYGDE